MFIFRELHSQLASRQGALSWWSFLSQTGPSFPNLLQFQMEVDEHSLYHRWELVSILRDVVLPPSLLIHPLLKFLIKCWKFANEEATWGRSWISSYLSQCFCDLAGGRMEMYAGSSKSHFCNSLLFAVPVCSVPTFLSRLIKGPAFSRLSLLANESLVK